MGSKTITAANSVLMLAVSGLFSVPQRIQGYSADAMFAFEDIENAETKMGVDGKLSAGWVPKEQPQTITLQADSASMFIFDQLIAQEAAQREKLWLQGSLSISAVGMKWTMTNGVLTRYTPVPEAKKTLEPRTFRITWESTQGVPTS